MHSRFDRFKDATWFQQQGENILVGGAGGISSWLVLLLTRAGFSPIVYDHDVYEQINMAGQFMKGSDVGKSKVQALKENINLFCDEVISVEAKKIDLTSPTHHYVICGFDNMRARSDMFHSWKKQYGNDPNAIFIDGRLTAEQLQIYCIRGSSLDMERYETNALFDDSEVAEAPCTFKQTSHAAAMIAAHMVGFFTNHVVNVIEKKDVRSVPFFWEYFIPMDMINVEE